MLIGVDWGTSRLRAYLMDEAGDVLDTVEADKGLMRVPAGGYEDTLRDVIAPWRDKAGSAPILMSGMVGSRQGWLEAPYLPLPTALADLAAVTLAVDAPRLGDVRIVPGLSSGEETGTWADVMRGEETEIFGALRELGVERGTFVLPGSHAKWIDVEGGAIVAFRTFMTGEMFQAISQHTILAKTIGSSDGNETAFRRGLDAGLELTAAGDLLARLFSIRAETLFGRLDTDDTASFLSGLLIGAEVACAAPKAGQVYVVGADGVAARYSNALSHAGVEVAGVPKGAAAAGLFLIAQQAGLTG